MKTSITSRIFYHIYPLGMCGAPEQNDFSSPAGNGLLRLIRKIPELCSLGINAVYIGPLFESSAHGYDTVDYYHVDRRLGTNDDLKKLVAALHENGIAVVLDAVFNHTGRHFFAFRDIQEKGWDSAYKDWYVNVDFSRRSPEGDSFTYESWNGCYDLVKLNTSNSAVREHLFGAVRYWIEQFNIDGLRLDAADSLDGNFMDALSGFCRAIDPDFWLMGEVVHGDYRNWAHEGRLDSVTNYESYKGLWSSFNDRNFFEIAWSMNRQFGREGLYPHLHLYNFVDNHDVVRAASVLKNPAHLYPLYGLLFTIPGVPSVYYGSENGVRGSKQNGSDAELRPALLDSADELSLACKPSESSAHLEKTISDFIRIRKEHGALQNGSYRQLFVDMDRFAFMRDNGKEQLIIAVNSGETEAPVQIPEQLLASPHRDWVDILAPEGHRFRCEGGNLSLSVPSSWLRILKAA
ncbi:alpha-amylase [Brucepastera parasyntrophica]|uniref:alpha-amylase family glycosyl hydrolase n=1 Tax=Brucepastera parasyntrophica TaxID=2880008 RepID=UPI002108BDBB|nr:alpha-amylase family glycosyl hydrolase [Brucepastera parasyntrophica]ULQ60543.1 alpha-amylase [Brucepastera parasyntrophica]